LTPIEAQAAGTPALMVDEGGYRFSIEDGVSGRLLARGDWKAWHAALAEAMDPATREAWSQAGSPPTPKDQADALQSIISILR
jgi:glycosyltransferase involved in cell wall biosynthesis